MNPIALFVENLSAFPPDRARRIHQRLLAQGLPGIDAVYALVWPNYAAPNPPRPQDNRLSFDTWRFEAGLPLWAWINCHGTQEDDAGAIAQFDQTLTPDGWLLDIEKLLEGARLKTLLDAVPKTKPRRASLAGTSPSHTPYDYRELDKQGFDVDWQSYPDTGEGPFPDSAVQEAYQSSFVLSGWEYRAQIQKAYGWGRVQTFTPDMGAYRSFNKKAEYVFGTLPRAWGVTVDDRVLFPWDSKKPAAGRLLGRAPYSRIRVTLDIASAKGNAVSNVELERRAASAKVPGLGKRPVSVYLAERDTPEGDRILAIARGSNS